MTDTFPFGKGEAFIEAEMPFWGEREDVKMTIIPLLARDFTEKRDIPKNSVVDIKLAKLLFKAEKQILFRFPLIFLNHFFWLELRHNFKVVFNIQKLRKLVACSVFSYITAKYLKKNYSSLLSSKETLVYSYWFYYAAYGAALLKRQKFSFKLISRAHGTDIFQDRVDTHCYIPFRSFPVWDNINHIYVASLNGANYLKSDQHIPNSKLSVSLLGVDVPYHICKSSDSHVIRLVSCSNLVAVKRVHLIVDALAHYASGHSEISIIWHHIGDGPLRESLETQAMGQLFAKNVKYEFLGVMSNEKVISYYLNNEIDCFITTSSSEGGNPVSIMEAISFGVPVIGTRVGGIPEAVNENNGCLLDLSFSNEDFALALDAMFVFKESKIRAKIIEYAKLKYSSKRNFSDFITLNLRCVEL